MIISASRRTDLPAFYAEWFLNRIRAGYCAVPNPMNAAQVSCVSLRPADVDVIAFWTRHPAPLLPHLDELAARGYRSFFHYTLMDNPRPMEARTPPLPVALETFTALAARIGPERLIWRYDPIILSSATPVDFHIATYRRIAEALRGASQRCVISILDLYASIRKRLAALKAQGIEIREADARPGPELERLLTALAALAAENGFEIQSCAEPIDLRAYGIAPGKCIDDAYIERVFGIQVPGRKDPSQREACGCVVSKDIGAYDTCLFGCSYCYATKSLERARANAAAHDPTSPSLLGWRDCALL